MKKIVFMKTAMVFFALYFGAGILFNGSSQFDFALQVRACAVGNGNAAKAVASQETSSSLADPAEAGNVQDFDPHAGSFVKGDLIGRFSNIATASYPGANGKTLFANCVGLVTFDGNGRFVDRETHSYDGVIVRRTYNGTYTIRADGTGTLRFVATDGSIAYNADFVLTNNQREIQYVVTLSPFVSSGIMKKQ